jgi:Lanthionine synthetase C-like protein
VAEIGPDGAVLAADALEWLLAMAQERGPALAWADRPDDDELDPTLYSGTAGIVLAFLEGYQHFGDDRYAQAAARGAQTLAATVSGEWPLSSLYSGLAGLAFTLRAVGDMLADRDARQAAARALDLVRSRFDGERWADLFELIGGNAGIALGAARAGDLDLAVLAVTPYLATAEPTAGGVHWEVRAGLPARFHHLSHGTLGIVYALAAVGHAAGRGDLTDLALAGAADVVSRNEAGPAGFLVPHSDPQLRPELIERYSYGWCHGPAGDAQAFRLLAQVTGDPAWESLAGRCWHTVTHSGLPNRLRPGFWDNNGRCCGTAGVLALACDRQAEHHDGLPFADILVSDLASRATVDAHGACWSNYEHRVSPPVLAARTGWAMGNAGIIRELLRYARVRDGQNPRYAVAWPDHPPVQ